MTRHLEPAVILEHAISMETGQQASRKPVLFLVWSLDPHTGKPERILRASSLPMLQQNNTAPPAKHIAAAANRNDR